MVLAVMLRFSCWLVSSSSIAALALREADESARAQAFSLAAGERREMGGRGRELGGRWLWIQLAGGV